MKVALYCRVDRGRSEIIQRDVILLQRKKLERYAERNDYQVIGCYEDYGFSGSQLNRPALTKLMIAFGKGEFDAVLVVNRDCLYRGELAKEPKWPFQVYSLNQREKQRER